MLFNTVQVFVDKAKHMSSLSELADLTQDITEAIGFDSFALLLAPKRNAAPADMLRLTTYPEAWVEIVRDRAYWVDDPVFAACEIADAGFLWRDLPNLVALSDRQREIMRLARSEGLHDGFTVPIPKGGATVALCSFATGRESYDNTKSTAAAQAVAWFAFEAARRIAETAPAHAAPPVPLTARQLDCTVLYARGMSDKVMARLLGISPKTCNEHIEIAKRRFGVTTRQQLLTRALWNGQITYADILS